MLQPSKTSEPIPGYVVKERIGVGGYGEVWSADAPGGLTKAIKFVYGYFDDERASRELKALHRIKQVRHPFLLSLERFEIVDGQLIIVSELADMSVKDRFEQAKAGGLPGIPREELLGYLRDAADALDYMRENFSLQHLDVKPENLLLVGGRVKVADFGLVKNVHDVTASQLGGLTPIYAPPEVFDGKPSEHSDQYSLAIVFQEMLTGLLPFPGRTPAQLASQHLHARPRLTPLPLPDQAVLAQALAKDPQKRFPSCRRLVDSLLSGRAESSKSAPSENRAANRPAPPAVNTASLADTDGGRAESQTQVAAGLPPRAQHTQVLAGQQAAPAAAAPSAPSVAPIWAPAGEVESLGPIDIGGCEPGIRPTLFLGIGGTAAQTLRSLRSQLRDRLGGAGALPSIGMLLLDTDAKGVYQATQGDPMTALTDEETLAIPLRSSHDYTTDSRNILQWLSRRWLYNIPRSLQTEGRRPLGRLALVDHAQQVLLRLRRALEQICSAEAMAASTAASGLSFRSQSPRVFLIASLSGGTGGGTVLDMAFAVRHLLAELGLEDDGLCGILTHSTDRSPESHDLAVANSYATLKELQYYSGTGSYPGDRALGLQPRPEGCGTFPSAYFVPLGDELNEQQFATACESLASYLYLDALTPAGAVLDYCRALTPAVNEDTGTQLRSFGLATIGSTHTALTSLATERLCHEVLKRWLAAPQQGPILPAVGPLIEIVTQANAQTEAVEVHRGEQLATEHAAELKLDFDSLFNQVVTLVEAELGGNDETIFTKLCATSEQQQTGGNRPLARIQQLLHLVHSLFGVEQASEPVPKTTQPALQAALERHVKELVKPVAEGVRQWILELVECSAVRVGGAARAKDWYVGHLRAIEAHGIEQLHEAQEYLQAAETRLLDVPAPSRVKMFASRRNERPAIDVEAALLGIVRLHIRQAALHGLNKLVRLIAAQVAAAGDQLKDLQRELGRLSTEFANASIWSDASHEPAAVESLGGVRAAVTDELRSRLGELADKVDVQFQTQVLIPQGGLRQACQSPEAMRTAIPAALRAMARAEVIAALRGISIVSTVLGEDAASQQERMQCYADAAKPALARCGGSQRLLAVVPQSAAEGQLPAALGQIDPRPTIVNDIDADLVFCFEAEQLAVPHVAARLIDTRTDLVEVASRLHARSDVNWPALPHVETPSVYARATI